MTRTRRSGTFVIFSVAMIGALALIACGGNEKPAAEAAPPVVAPAKVAVAQLEPLGDSGVAGRVVFTQSGDSVEVSADITGLTPGDHGFHIHEVGDCSAPDGSSAGGHFNPAGVPHAGPGDAEAHVGDLGNVTADANGHAMLELTKHHARLDGANSVVGRSVIVHEKADDLMSQPTGAAGGRVACGVIRLDGDAS